MDSSNPVPKAFPLVRRILSCYQIHDLHDSGQNFCYRVNSYYKNVLLLVVIFSIFTTFTL